MNIEERFKEIQKKYDSEILEAHTKIICHEKEYKNRSYKESQDIIKNIQDIIEEIANVNK